MKTRDEVIKLAQSWIGKNEKDGSYKSIIDVYNSYKGQKPRGLKMQYDWSWCACTWSALAIKLGYTDIMPIEISCGELIEAAKKMGVWVEKDSYVPKPADGILYDWQDNGKGDNTGWPDHVGVVESVDNKYITVIEGNYQDSVKRRKIQIDGKFIRGFITPKYDDNKKTINQIAKEVIAGKWGTGEDRKKKLESAGYDYTKVQKKVNSLLKK